MLQYEARRSDRVLLAMLVSLALSFGAWHSHLFGLVTARPTPAAAYLAEPRTSALPSVVYGTGLAHDAADSRQLTCTAMATDTDMLEHCTAWMYLQPGQRAVEAAPLPPDTNCAAVAADQQTGRWTCTASSS